MVECWLTGQGVEVSWAKDHKTRELEVVPSAAGADLVISFGGDGTLLRAARMVGYEEIPILGLSYGHLGFLTGAGSEAIIESVGRALAGEMHISRRATLSVDVDFVDHGRLETTRGLFCLNELALTRGGMGDIVEFDVAVSGAHIDRLRADGFIVATATGSTGYALSAGGPIVTPEFNGMVCVPVAPHTILARAFLTSPSDVVTIDVSPERPVERVVFCDGMVVGHGAAAVHVDVRRGPGDIILLDEDDQSFYRSVSRVFYGGPRL